MFIHIQFDCQRKSFINVIMIFNYSNYNPSPIPEYSLSVTVVKTSF